MFDLYLLLASDDADAPDHAPPAPRPTTASPRDRDDDAPVERARYHVPRGDGDTAPVAIAA